MTLLEAISPTAAALVDPDIHFFSVRYYWHSKVLGELCGNTVIFGADAEAALKSFLSKHRHLSRAEII